MFKRLKGLFDVKNSHSTPVEWTEESWSTSDYEASLSGSNKNAFTASGLPGVVAGLAAGMTAGSFMDSTDTNSHSSWDDTGPRFNIDGTPMMGSVDMNGNLFGITQSDSFSSSFDSFSSSFGSDSMFSSNDPF